jgi:Ni,Fe-hydrogenase maturation factor
MTAKTRIAALGSFTEGDNVAWQISMGLTDALGTQGVDKNRIEVTQYRLPTDLLQNLDAYEQLIVLDAFIPENQDPKLIRIQLPEERHKLKSSADEYSTHGIDIISVISLAKSLRRLPASVVIYGINCQATVNQALTKQLALLIREDLNQSLCV